MGSLRSTQLEQDMEVTLHERETWRGKAQNVPGGTQMMDQVILKRNCISSLLVVTLKRVKSSKASKSRVGTENIQSA
jgi:hypothetical protein